MAREGNIYRPPSEAMSYIVQCTVGCSHNACTFCGMFKDKKFRVKDMDEIRDDIKEAARRAIFRCFFPVTGMPSSASTFLMLL